MMKNKYKIICVVLCTFCMLIFFALSFGVLNVKAYADISVVDEKTLYNETNTYNISDDCFDNNGFISTYESTILGEYKDGEKSVVLTSKSLLPIDFYNRQIKSFVRGIGLL